MAQTISSLARSLGLNADTLRYYERLGLLPPIERNPAGYRVYDQDSADRVRFIKGVQRMGLRLKDIKELLEVRDLGQCPCGHTQTLVRHRLSEVEDEIRQLKAVRRQLLELEERNQRCLESTTGSQWASVSAIDGRR
jgi:DNA-binding transcriptional MerR regulator